MPLLTPPPDRHPRRPTLAVPAGAWDCQLHVFGSPEDYPVDPTSRYVPAQTPVECAIETMDALGIDYGVVVSGGAYGRDYRCMEAALRAYPDRFRGVILPPYEMDEAELLRLHRLGVRGMRFFSDGHLRNLPRVLPELAAKVQALGLDWAVQFYPHREDLPEYVDRLLSLPLRRIVLDHFAAIPAEGGMDRPAYAALLRLLDSGRVWVKLSGAMHRTSGGLPYPAVAPLARALVNHAPERMLWASDWPHVNLFDREMPNDGDLLDLLSAWAPSAADRQRILTINPTEVFGQPPDSDASLATP